MTAYRPVLDGIYAVIGCKLKQNANEGCCCKSCAFLCASLCFMFYCMFYFTCDRSFSYTHVDHCVNLRVWSTAQQCPTGYNETSDGRCLQVVVDTQHQWLHAQQYCKTTGGRLARVLAVNDPVVTAVRDISGISKLWIGLQKTRTDWHYASGIRFSIIFTLAVCF